MIALRRDRGTDGAGRRVASWLFHRVFAGIASVPVTRDAGDFRLLSRPVIDALKSMPERTRYYDEVKARPLYIVRRRIGFDADESGS